MNWLEFANVGAAVALSSALNAVCLGLPIVGLAALFVRTLPRSNASTRYAIWMTALLLVLAMPVALTFTPRMTPMAATSAQPALVAPVTVPATATWPIYAILAWAAIATLLLSRVTWSLLHVRGLKRRATVIGYRGRTRLMVSPEVRVPLAAGFIRRAILFPHWAIDELSAQEFEQVLCHELAHLRRWDDWAQLAQTIAEALFFFNPALHLIGRRLRIEREIACDDWVVNATGKARPYAACLTHLHELTRRVAVPQLAPGVANGRRWQITARVEALLSADRDVTARFSRSGWIAAAALASAALLVSAEAPPLIGVGPLSVPAMPIARLAAPSAPLISMTPHRVAQARPRLLAAHVTQPAPFTGPATPANGQYVLVQQWQTPAAPVYWVITVVWFEPPPQLILEGI